MIDHFNAIQNQKQSSFLFFLGCYRQKRKKRKNSLLLLGRAERRGGVARPRLPCHRLRRQGPGGAGELGECEFGHVVVVVVLILIFFAFRRVENTRKDETSKKRRKKINNEKMSKREKKNPHKKEAPEKKGKKSSSQLINDASLSLPVLRESRAPFFSRFYFFSSRDSAIIRALPLRDRQSVEKKGITGASIHQQRKKNKTQKKTWRLISAAKKKAIPPT